MKTALKDYHWAWLESHPERTKEWLQRRLKDGFDIHHLDGDKSNNIPQNLILIECRDHMRLHGMNVSRVLSNGLLGPSERRSLGESAYYRRRDGEKWRPIADDTYPQESKGVRMQRTINAAKAYAEYHKLEWPPLK